MSVRLVTVMETPAWRSESPTFSDVARSLLVGSFPTFSQHCMITNISSIPIPRQMNGRMACMGVYGKPRMEASPTEVAIPIPMLVSPAKERYTRTWERMENVQQRKVTLSPLSK